LQTKPSAFDRINVRFLFIYLQKAVRKTSRYFLFEQNDAQTRSRYYNTVEPFFRNVQGRRGIEAYRIVVDETVNTEFVRQRKEFVAQFYIAPVYAINFIRLEFIADRFGNIVGFSETEIRN